MLISQYIAVRKRTEWITAPLSIEDFVVQPVEFVSPPKWHLGHTTWFFETFLLKEYVKGYKEFDINFNYIFNSYYETVGARVIRTDRGNLSRPSVEEVYKYRKYVDDAMTELLSNSAGLNDDMRERVILGLNHEEQHQELLFSDMKYILGHNPLFPPYRLQMNKVKIIYNQEWDYLRMEEGVYEIGHKGKGFCFDNELGRHKVYLQEYEISRKLVTNEEYMEFIDAGGYKDFRHWHAEGWDWVKRENIGAPMYWHLIDGVWHTYSMDGLVPVELTTPVVHISYYEAHAYAAWKGERLPTEFEWEAASSQLLYGKRWEWTESAYLPYPGFRRAPGALGEYNGKFMVNQMVLRGWSTFTSPGHGRVTYRNFFHPHLRWQFTGIRLAKQHYTP